MTDAMEIPGGWVTLGRPGPIVAIGSQPAAGSDWSVRLPAGSVCRLLTVRAVLTTSATVGNRVAQLQLATSNGDVLTTQSVPISLTASTVAPCTWAVGLDTVSAGLDELQMGLPKIGLPPGCSVRTNTLHLDAGDQWSAVVVMYEMHPYAPAHWPTTSD